MSEASIGDPGTIDRAVAILLALAHPGRLKVVLLLHEGGPTSVGTLATLTQTEPSAMSHQLRLLRDAEIVVARRERREVWYSLKHRGPAELACAAVNVAAITPTTVES